MKIIEIEIQYFRSIENLSFKPYNMNIFTGNNNSGKSNILKVLNLFFNGETGYKEKFIFKHDHNKLDKRKQKNISIKIKFEVSHTYKNIRYIEEKKTWLPTGNLSERPRATFIHYYNENFKMIEMEDIPAGSKIRSLYANKKYFYVPAIKGKEYFSDLLGQLYSSIQYNADDISESAKDFEKKLTEIVSPLFKALKDNSPTEQNDNENETATLPDHLTPIFENLDIRTDKSEISLNRRGDGVRSWQIPIILKYIYDTINQKRGSSTPVFWGMEEPENNIELSSAFKIANLLKKYSDDCQTFMTTHSPAIYSIHDQQNVLTHYVKKRSHAHSEYYEVTEKSDIRR